MHKADNKSFAFSLLMIIISFGLLIWLWFGGGKDYFRMYSIHRTPIAATESIQIILSDRDTGKPIAFTNTYITVNNSPLIVRTNNEGIVYLINKDQGGDQFIKISIWINGYKPENRTISLGDYPVLFFDLAKFAGTETPNFSTITPDPVRRLDLIFKEIDRQFEDDIKANIAFNKPEQMKKDETQSIELLISSFQPQSTLAAIIEAWGDYATSTAEPNVLIAPNGEVVAVVTGQVEITPRMKAVLFPQDADAFTVKAMHDNAEQVISSVEATTWRWSITAKKEGQQTLELIIYQLVKYDGKEFWHEVETYKAEIVVEVTVAQKIRSLDWKWIAAFIVTLVGAIIGVWKWLDERKKKPGVMQVKIVDEKKDTKRRKKLDG